MIRLVALKQWADYNKLTALEIKALCQGNWKFEALFRVVPYALCRNDAYELPAAQSLSGIPQRLINAKREDTITNMQFTRIRRLYEMPEGWICNQSRVQYTQDEYVEWARNFWYSVLKPLQFKDYPEELTTYEKYLGICIKARSSSLSLMFPQDGDVQDLLETARSSPEVKPGDLRYLTDKPTQQQLRFLGSEERSLRHYTKHQNFDRIPQLLERYALPIERCWSLLAKCNCQGIINDDLMEVYYEYLYREQCNNVSFASGMEQTATIGSTPVRPVRIGEGDGDFF